MKHTLIGLCILAVTSAAAAADVVSIDRGRELFTSKQLGTNGKSCSSCHADGSGLSTTSLYEEAILGEIVNQCILTQLKGKELGADSAELKSLVKYLRLFSPYASQ